MAAHEKEMHDCIICASALGTNGGTLTLLCGHPFCAECICRWRQRSWRCPVCRVMDNRDLSATAALSAGRAGNIGQVSRRLRPMAEQLLAENGDNVLDVLLQLLKGIQDGTLPADVETAVSDVAGSSSARALSSNPGGTSLDRLVLNQLVTVLQATSALSGAGRQSTATPGQGSSQAAARPSSSNSRRRRHPSERRRAPAAVQPSAQEPLPAFPVAAVLPEAQDTAAPLQESDPGPSSRPRAPEALERRSPLGPVKCDASTQTSDFSDREERRLRGSRLRRESRGAVLEGAVSISPKPRAGQGSSDGPAASSMPSAADLLATHGTQPVWHSSTGGSDCLAGLESASSVAEAAPSIGDVKGKMVSKSKSSGLSVPSAAAKGKAKESAVKHMIFMAGPEATGSGQHSRPLDLPDSSIVSREASAGQDAQQGQFMNQPRPMVAGTQSKGRAIEEQLAPSGRNQKVEVSGEAPALDFRQIRRAWEERFGPSRQSAAVPLRKRSLEGPSLSDSTSGCSSASFPASGMSTPLMPSMTQAAGSAAARSVPSSSSRPALGAPGPSEAGSSPDAATVVVPGVLTPLETSPVSVHKSQVPVFVGRPSASQFPAAPEQQGTCSSGLDVSPDPNPALPHQSLEPLSMQQTEQQPPQSRAGQRSSDSSEATIPSLLEAPDTATPSASDESFGDATQADDSAFIASRATSLARTLSPEELSLAEIPHSSPSESALPEETRPLATADSAPATSMRLPTSLLGRRRTRSEAEEARAARQRPVLAPPNTATQSLANSGSSSPRTMLEPISVPPSSFAAGPMPQAGQGSAGGSKPSESNTPHRTRTPQPAPQHSLEREQLLLRAVDEVENLVDNLLAKWNGLPAAEQPPHLGERLEELFLEASMLEAVRNNQVPKPRAMVEDILARVMLLDTELGTHMGTVPPPSPTSSMGSPHATGTGPQVPSPKLLQSPVRTHSGVPETQLGVSGQPGLPSSQQSGQQSVPSAVVGLEPSESGPLSAPQQLTHLPQGTGASAAEEQAPQVPQALVQVPGPQAPIRVRAEPQQPVSPLSAGRMTQGTSTRLGHRPGSARAGASERRARRSAAARLAAAPPSGQDAAEAAGALDRFTAFLEHHENELQPRTRQIAELALTLARLSLVTGTSERTSRPAATAPDTHPSPAP